MMDLGKEVADPKRRLELLELRDKVEELERKMNKPIFVPYPTCPDPLWKQWTI